MTLIRNFTALSFYVLIVIHYNLGYRNYKSITDPYLSRPSLKRYEDSAEFTPEVYRQVHTSSSDPNINSRLNRLN